MPREVLPPAELHARLTAQLAGRARHPEAAHQPGSVRRVRGPRRLAGALLATFTMLALAVTAIASHGPSTIDLTASGAIVESDGAVFAQGAIGAGTGNFNPFLTLSTNASTEKGYNVCDGCPGEFDTFTGGNARTHELPVAGIPVVTYQGDEYREFVLDANEQGAAATQFLSVDVIKLFLDDQPDLFGYNIGAETFGNDNASAATKIWESPHPILMNAQGLQAGSGESDITVLVPNDLFPDECGYGSPDCDLFLILYTEKGNAGVVGGRNYAVDAGFEEWNIVLRPVVSVEKTAVPSFDREYDWTITKSVDIDELDLFNGQSGDVEWTVEWDRDDGTDSNFQVSGEISITNPTDSEIIPDAIPATITGVTDVIDMGGGPENVTVDCPVTFPFVLAAQATLTCTYTHDLDAGGTGTNTATATINDGAGGSASYSDDADIDFTGVTPDEIDGTATVTDDRAPLDRSESGDGSTSYTETFTCDEDEGTHENTAVVTEDDSGQTDDDTASVTVNCYELTVTKDADTSFTRDHDWDIAKTRVILPEEIDGDGDPSTLTLADSQTYDINYEITVWTTGYTDSDWAVTGTITIANPAPIDAVDVGVSDVVSVGINAVVDCDDVTAGNQTTVTIPANDSVDCSYSADLPDGTDRLNTATASLFGEDYTGDADVLFDGDSDVTELDTCIDVWDDNGTPADDTDDTYLGEVCLDDLDAEDSFTFSHSIEVGPYECGEHTFTNVARFEASDTDESGSDDYIVAIDVPCPEGCTLTPGYWKTHNESFPGGAPADDTWLLILPSAEDSPFFLSGQTYFEVLWTAPKGNVYYNLSFHYIAAELNMLNGADGSSIQAAFDTATGLFQTYTPAQIGALKGNNAIRQQFISLAGTLGSYNEGLIGPGHCDDDGSGGSTAFAGRAMAADLRRAFG